MRSKMKTRFLCALLSVAMVFGMMPEYVRAEEEVDQVQEVKSIEKQNINGNKYWNGVRFELYSDGCMSIWQDFWRNADLICDYTGDGSHTIHTTDGDYIYVNDPSEYYYYKYADQVKFLEIGQIDDTFASDMYNVGGTWYCDGGVFAIGAYAFYGYRNLEKLVWRMYSHDKDYEIREYDDGSTTEWGYEVYIHNYAFANCYNLKEIYLIGTDANDGRILEDDEMENLAANTAFSGVTAMVYVYPESGIKPTSSMVKNYGGNLTWAYNYDRVNLAKDAVNHTISAYLTFDGKLVIRGTGDMKDFSSITEVPWANEGSMVKEIVIEDGITGIGNYAFSSCGEAVSVTIPESVIRVGDRAFRSNEKLKEIKLPSKLVSIGSYAFYDCLSLESIEIPASVKSIGSYSFSSCTGLKKVTLNEGLNSIGAYAFYDCTGLTELTIPSTVNSLGKLSLNLNAPSAKVEFLCTNVSVDGSVFSAGATGRIYATSPKGGVWTESFKAAISDNSPKVQWQLEAASGVCGDNLVWTYQNHTLTITGTGKMYDYSLTKPAPWEEMKADMYHVSLSEGLESIGSYAFYGTGIYEVTIPESVTAIGSRAFSNMKDLSPVTFMGKPANIASDAFYGQETFVYYNSESGWTSAAMKNYGGSLEWEQAGGRCGDDLVWNLITEVGGSKLVITGSGAMYDYNALTSPFANLDIRNLVLPEGLTHIGNYAFKGKSIQSVTLPSSLVSIGEEAFRGCSLQSVTLPGSVETLGNYAFADCTGLTEFVFPEKATDLYIGILQGCTSLKSVKFSSKLTTIPYNIVQNCGKLENVAIPVGVTSIGQNAFAGCTSLTEFVIPDSVKKIWHGAFDGCTGIKSLTLPSKITEIGNRVFRNMTGLQEISLPGSIDSIGKDAFSGCTSLTSVFYGGTQEEWQDVSINATGNAVLSSSGCTIYYLGGSWNGMEWNIDLDTGLLTVSGSGEMSNSTENPWTIYGEKIRKVVAEKGITRIGNSAFAGLTKLESVSLPDGLTAIGDSAFAGDTSLKTVNIPGTVTNIGTYAFSTSAIQSVIIPEGVSTLAKGTFNRCADLKSVTLPKSLLGIGQFNFRTTTSLKDIYYAGSKAEWDEIEIGTANEILQSVNTAGNATLHCSGVVNGTLGDNITWVVTEQRDVNNDKIPDILLQISGTGDMAEVGETAPWNKYYAGKIQYLYISEGVTGICSNAFAGNKIQALALPMSMTKIGTDAFKNCTVKDVAYAGSAEQYKQINVQSGNDALKNANMVMNWSLELESCTVTFKMNGHGTQVKSQSVNVGGKATEPKTPTAKGYDFDGWYTDEECTRAYNFDDVLVDSLTLYAAWSSSLTVTDPEDTTVKTGELAAFDVQATSGTGLKLNYRWKKSTDGGKTWVNSSSTGAKTPHLEMTAKSSFDGLWFRCDVTDEKGKTVSSKAVVLHVVDSYKITKQPSAIVWGALNGTATFEVACNDPKAAYQWQKSTDGKTWKNCGLAGADQAVYPVKPVKESYEGMQFRCKVTCSDGKVLYSEAATLKIGSGSSQPIILKPVSATSVSAGTAATFTVSASGEGLTYQWKKSTDGGKTWVNSVSTGAKTNTLTMTAKESFNSYLFKCVITDVNGNVVESAAAKLTVKAASTTPAITTQPTNLSVTAGATATFKVTAAGEGLTYQWKKSTDGGKTWVNSASTGAKTNTLTMATKASYNGLQFKCVVTDKNGKSLESNAATLTVK